MIFRPAIFLAALTLAAATAPAFDSEGWLEKRAFLDREAERLAEAFAKCAARADQPAEGIVIPIENYPSGAVKTNVSAGKAQYFLEEGLVWGERVKVTQYGEDGKAAASVEAERCVIDRATKSGWAEGHAKVTAGGTTVEGDGVYFSAAEEYVRITSKTEIVSRELKFGGFKL